jgi:hypothetical protein
VLSHHVLDDGAVRQHVQDALEFVDEPHDDAVEVLIAQDTGDLPMHTVAPQYARLKRGGPDPFEEEATISEQEG